MRIVALAWLVFITLTGCASVGGPYYNGPEDDRTDRMDSLAAIVQRTDATIQENERLTSVLLAVALGPFGGHRLYLGTGAKVPIIYTLTLGGGFGVLPTIDMIHLLMKKDLEPYRNNTQVFMWAKPRETRPTPP